MTVSELIDILKEYPSDKQIAFSYNYGDYWKTNVVETIEQIEETSVSWSEYHRMYKLEDEPEEDETNQSFVVLFG